MPTNVSIIGVGMTRFHHKIHRDKSGRELFIEAAKEALGSVDKGIDLKDIQSLFVGYFTPESYEHQGHIGALMTDWLGLYPIPAWRTESACASSSFALLTGILAVSAGWFDIVMVGGVEKMTNRTIEQVTDALAMAADDVYEIPVGITFPGLYALVAQAYLKEYSATWEELQTIPIKNHHNGSLNPKAQFQKEIIDIANDWGKRQNISFKDPLEFLKSPLNRMVAYPLKLFDCCPISDGAAVAILTSSKIAKRYTDTPIKVLGYGAGTDTLSLHDRDNLVSFQSTVKASRQAYKMAGIKSKDIDVADVHDCFSIAEALATEDLGFFERGDAIKAAQEGRTALDGEIPINPDGGLKCKGHPVGATGIGMLYEIWKQLRGTAKGRQVADAEIGLVHNVGGSGASAAVVILGR